MSFIRCYGVITAFMPALSLKNETFTAFLCGESLFFMDIFILNSLL